MSCIILWSVHSAVIIFVDLEHAANEQEVKDCAAFIQRILHTVSKL